MKRVIPLALLALLPLAALAATFTASRTVLFSEPASDNAYLLGGEVNVTAHAGADLYALGGSINISAPIDGDAFLSGATVTVSKPVKGDVRIVAGRAVVNENVSGDLVVVAASFRDSGGGARDVLVAAGSASLLNGAEGPVHMYSADAFLSGTFLGDVHVMTSNHLQLGEGTIIHGTLFYDAPQQVVIPASVHIDGGAKYTGHSYLPTTAEARAFLAAGAGLFLLVKILATLIVAGLLVGLFPSFAQMVADRTLRRSLRRFLLTTLLGFGVLVATPILLILLSLTLVGLGLALLLGLSYLLALVLAYCFTAIIMGSALARRLLKREQVLWRDTIVGVLVLFIVGSVPFLGWIFLLVLLAASLGSLVSVAYEHAFKESEETPPFSEL